jgi:hypothetical protein
MFTTITLAWLSGKYDLDPWALYIGTMFVDLGIVQVLLVLAQQT